MDLNFPNPCSASGGPRSGAETINTVGALRAFVKGGYDAVGNRKALSSTLPPAGAMNYTYNAADDRLASDQHDPDGNTLNSGGIANTYDFENHLVTHGGVSVVYDGDGNRVSETVAGVTTNYLVDTANPTGYVQVVDEVSRIPTISKTILLHPLERRRPAIEAINPMHRINAFDSFPQIAQHSQNAGSGLHSLCPDNN